jgi:polyhydroxyalkanoate synthesis regulator phasin
MADEKKNDVPFDPAALMENAFLMGIGVLDVTREKAEGFAAELIERGKVSTGDAKKVADRVTEIAESQQDAVRKTVGPEIEKVMKTSGVATKSEVDELKAQIAELKAMLAGAPAASQDEVIPPSYPDE